MTTTVKFLYQYEYYYGAGCAPNSKLEFHLITNEYTPTSVCEVCKKNYDQENIKIKDEYILVRYFFKKMGVWQFINEIKDCDISKEQLTIDERTKMWIEHQKEGKKMYFPDDILLSTLETDEKVKIIKDVENDELSLAIFYDIDYVRNRRYIKRLHIYKDCEKEKEITDTDT